MPQYRSGSLLLQPIYFKKEYMRLTNNIRDAFIKAAMDDVPSVDHKEEIRSIAFKDIVDQLPINVQKVYKDSKTRDFIKTAYCTYGGVSVTVPSVSGYSSDSPKLTEEAKKKVGDLKAANQANQTLRGELSSKLRNAAYGCTTRKQLAELLPEFESYLPSDEAKATKMNLPAVANVLSDFVKAGWPKNQKKMPKQITI